MKIKTNNDYGRYHGGVVAGGEIPFYDTFLIRFKAKQPSLKYVL